MPISLSKALISKHELFIFEPNLNHMSKINLCLLGLLSALFISSCKISEPVFPESNFGNAPSTADTYQPVTKGSFWKYQAIVGNIQDTSTNTITGATATFNNKNYYVTNSVSHAAGSNNGYYYAADHKYMLRSSTIASGITLEFYYLNDTMAVNHTWTAPLSDNGLVNGVPGRVVGKVMEKGINKTVGGKAFSNVIHTQIDLQYDLLGTGFQSITLYDYYVAKGIGIIKIETSAMGVLVGSSDLIDYSIK